jgi:hypothetical protein
MGLGNVIDQFHYEYRLTNTGATKQANLPATLVRATRIHDFNACLKDGTGGIQVDVSWGRAMD